MSKSKSRKLPTCARRIDVCSTCARRVLDVCSTCARLEFADVLPYAVNKEIWPKPVELCTTKQVNRSAERISRVCHRSMQSHCRRFCKANGSLNFLCLSFCGSSWFVSLPTLSSFDFRRGSYAANRADHPDGAIRRSREKNPFVTEENKLGKRHKLIFGASSYDARP